MQTIHVKLFARFAEVFATKELVVELVPPVTPTDLRRELIRRKPELQSLLEASALAINEEYAAESQLIAPGDEVALIPPVSGG